MALSLAVVNVPAFNLPFAPAPKKASAPPAFAFGLPGNFNALGGAELNFDPAGFLEGKSEVEVNRYRECELTHGRVGMLASAGFLVQEKFHPLFSGDGGPAIDQIPALPSWVWGVMLIGITGCEIQRIAVGPQGDVRRRRPRLRPARPQARGPGRAPHHAGEGARARPPRHDRRRRLPRAGGRHQGDVGHRLRPARLLERPPRLPAAWGEGYPPCETP